MSNNQHYLFILKDYLEDKGQLHNSVLPEAIDRRKSGEEFNLPEHIKGLVYALLSADMKWESVESNLDQIDEILYYYDPQTLQNANPKQLNANLKDIKCGSRTRAKQMKALAGNIDQFNKIIADYGSIDKFINSADLKQIILRLSDSKSSYKLNQLGIPLVCEYLRRMGIDTAKPDRHICRFLSKNRMGVLTISKNPTAKQRLQILDEIEKLSRETGLQCYEIDNIIWSFCAAGYGEICTEKPHCEKCPIKHLCNYSHK